jgi:hypothetical protein
MRIGLPGVTVVADAGLLSQANLAAIEDVGLRFIVGAGNRSADREGRDGRCWKDPGDMEPVRPTAAAVTSTVKPWPWPGSTAAHQPGGSDRRGVMGG